MTVSAIRFRNEGNFVVLQVLAPTPENGNGYPYEIGEAWRDAEVTDLLEAARFTCNPGAGSGSTVRLSDMAQYIGPRQQWAP